MRSRGGWWGFPAELARPHDNVGVVSFESQVVFFGQQLCERFGIVCIESASITTRADYITRYVELRHAVVTVEFGDDVRQCVVAKHQAALTPSNGSGDVRCGPLDDTCARRRVGFLTSGKLCGFFIGLTL